MNDIERLIKQEFEEQTPDLKSRIISRAAAQEQISPDSLDSVSRTASSGRKRLGITRMASIAAMLFIVFTVGIILGNFVGLPTPEGEYASLYFDVNPSIELTVTEEGAVRELILLNDDARAALSELKLEGVELNTAINAVIGALYMNGYLKDGTDSILVSASIPSERFDGLLNSAVTEVNSIISRANIACSLVAQELKRDEKIENQASANNVSVGKMSLINKIVESIDEYTDADAGVLAGMSINELNHLYNSAKEPSDSDNHEPDDFFEIIGSNVPTYVDKDDAFELVLETLGVDGDDVKNAKIYAVHGVDGEGLRLIYKVSFEYGGIIYDYEVDCITANITLIGSNPSNFGAESNPEPSQDGMDDKNDRPDKKESPSIEDVLDALGK